MRGGSRSTLLCCLTATLLAAVSASCERQGADEPVTPVRRPVEVLVVTSLEPMLEAAIDRYAPQRGALEFVVRPGSSQSIARQVQAGARADLVVSGDAASLRGLDPAPRSNRAWLVNPLVVVAPTASTAALRDFDFGQARLAVADETTDLGLLTRLAMRQRETWNDSQGRLLRMDGADDVLAAVVGGDAGFGVVQATDASDEPGVRIVGRLALPETVAPEYVLAVYSDAGDRLAAWLDGPEGVSLAREWGYEQASSSSGGE